MSIFSENIRLLRHKKNLSQQSFAESLGMSRVRYSKYEDGRSEAPYEILIRISKFFNVSIDLLLTLDISKYPVDNMMKLPENRVVLPIIVDSDGENYIEIVPQKASMGYLKGYSDNEYIEKLARMKLPFLKNAKYRAFLADGDSMPPFADGSYIIGEYVEQLEDLKSGKEYIFITSDGITFKTFVEQNNESVTVSADNTFYEPYQVPLDNVLEIWKYVRGILPENYKLDNTNDTHIGTILQELKTSIKELDDKVSLIK
ncbi:LexA family transcriptional regulator [Chryseobacterium chendengshani]|uniref:XRE family transcriptional regulator n=1 Tax=Chryseobacterium sp. LJ668 TaxID=2864040 RepID=UPI001C69420A|nr:LexA family transcriptional regulator [Chryseobacterium sp. LJ668]MBW8523528.1 LexA family transcriptional regulator [Chryseobacterium sp. LJ668]QYK15811.1 LexA family transcriptional regulator [Chryseobacterium sp. LJ668]